MDKKDTVILQEIIIKNFRSFLNKQYKRPYRFIVGISGTPASGKSTLAEKLTRDVNKHFQSEIANVVNMDGFHLYNNLLHLKGIHTYKGAHFTFDAEGFIQKLIEVKESTNEVSCPVYSREIHEPVQDKNIIGKDQRLIFAEGNYLLLSVFPWNTIRYLLDYSVFAEVDEKTQHERLMRRHTHGGMTPHEAALKIQHTDLPNSTLILKDKELADLIVG